MSADKLVLQGIAFPDAILERDAKVVAQVREQIAEELEDEASQASYRSPEEVTHAYLKAAKIARGVA